MSDDDCGVEVQHWTEVLDFVERIASSLCLSGWSIGVVEHGLLRTYTRGFAPDVIARYAELPLDAPLPGPVSVRTGRDQYFPAREDAHRSYPLAAGIDVDSRHVAAATLVLWGSRAAVGYLALHFDAPQAFDDEQRGRLERLAASVAVVMPAQTALRGASG